MKNIFFIVSCLFMFSTPSYAKVLQFLGSSNSGQKEIILKSKSIDNIDSLEVYIRDLGFLDVKIYEKIDTFTIRLGEQYYLKRIYLNTIVRQNINQNLNFTKKNITKEINNILQAEKEKGFQFATIVIDSTVIVKYSIDLFCRFNKGPRLKLDNLKFQGLKKTNISELQKYFTLQDSIITPKYIKRIEKDAYAIPFVQFVPPILQEIKQGYLSADLILPFVEKEHFLFEGGGGYFSDQDLFVWKLNLQFNNLFGKGRKISLLSQKKDITNQNLKLQYQQPLFLLGVGSASFFVQTRDYRNQFYEFLLNSSIQTFYKKKVIFSFQSLYKSVEQDNDFAYRSYEVSFAISNKKTITTSLNQTKFFYDSKFSYGNRKYASDTSLTGAIRNSFNESRINIRTQFYRPIFQNIAMYTSVRLQSYQTDENLPPFAELYLVGGTGSIRGFKDEQFPSIRNLIFTAEPFYQSASGSFFLFYDGGYIYNRISTENSEFNESTLYKYGYGGGVSLFSNKNSLKISLGWNKLLSFDNPRISLELKTQL